MAISPGINRPLPAHGSYRKIPATGEPVSSQVGLSAPAKPNIFVMDYDGYPPAMLRTDLPDGSEQRLGLDHFKNAPVEAEI
jgi:hypothetical protein